MFAKKKVIPKYFLKKLLARLTHSRVQQKYLLVALSTPSGMG
jgi:hypothetical protein